MFIKFKLPVAMLALIALSVLCSSVYVQETLATKLISNRLPVDALGFQSRTASNPLVASQSALHHMQSLPKLMTTSLVQANQGAVANPTVAEHFSSPKMLEQSSLDNPESKQLSLNISSLDELMGLFDSLNYTPESFRDGNKSVPRLTFDAVGEGWSSVSSQLPVKQKKMVFLRMIAPLVLLANEKILQERQVIMSAPLDDIALLALGVKYKVISSEDKPLLEAQRQMLLERVDILPPSLVLAQAAKESGWGTSRFAREGNALFGQWDFKGNGMEPRQKRQGLGNYGLARFDTPFASVEGYLLNLNTHNAYQKMRDFRAQSRQANQAVTGSALAGTLDRYSERGHAYVEAIRQMIRTNKLYLVDDIYLSDDAPLHLLTRTN